VNAEELAKLYFECREETIFPGTLRTVFWKWENVTVEGRKFQVRVMQAFLEKTGLLEDINK